MLDTAIQQDIFQQDMPRRRDGHTTAVTIGEHGERFYLTANACENGRLCEVFIKWGKQGSTPAGLMEMYALALSVNLQSGIPLVDHLHQLLDLRFEPLGETDDPQIPHVRSPMDWVARRLAIDWLPYTERAAEGIYTAAELARGQLDTTVADFRAELSTGIGALMSQSA
jgi:ribonucleoside-diphosphate reductase alpha chain